MTTDITNVQMAYMMSLRLFSPERPIMVAFIMGFMTLTINPKDLRFLFF